MLTATPPQITSLNGRVYENKPFNPNQTKTLTKDLVSIDTLDTNEYPAIYINLSNGGVLVWAFESDGDRDSNYTNLLNSIPQ